VHLAYTPGIALERKLAAQFLQEEKSPSRFRSRGWLQPSVRAVAAIAVVGAIISIPMLPTSRETDAAAAEIFISCQFRGLDFFKGSEDHFPTFS